MQEFADNDIHQVRANLLELLPHILVPGGNYLVQPLRGELVEQPTTIAALTPKSFITDLETGVPGIVSGLYLYITNHRQRGKVIHGFKNIIGSLNLPQQLQQQLHALDHKTMNAQELELMYARLPVLTLLMNGLEGKSPGVTLIAEHDSDIIGNFNTLKGLVRYKAVNYIDV